MGTKTIGKYDIQTPSLTGIQLATKAYEPNKTQALNLASYMRNWMPKHVFETCRAIILPTAAMPSTLA